MLGKNSVSREGALPLPSPKQAAAGSEEVLEKIVFVDFHESKAVVEQSLELIQRSLAGLADGSPVAEAIERRLGRFADVYRREGAGLLVAIGQGGTVVATAGYGSFANLPMSESTCEVRDLAVSPVARGMGLGKRILLLTLRHATNVGYRKFYLETTSKMQSAVCLFTKIGFEPVEQQAEAVTSSSGAGLLPVQKSEEKQVPCYFHCKNWQRFLPYGANQL